ncbi:MAG: viperin family antiviral radical SAM protein [Deltaproteobacteria bacterium]|nr:viperin family antiviral radical SAM protein [Deltaproteobacteria bacterium]
MESVFPKAINFHLLRECNAKCRYCFATFRETHGRLSTDDALAVMASVRAAGGQKMNFVGGEPTLHPDIERLVCEAKSMGFTTSIVSNGKRLARLLASSAGAALDWVGLSVDSATDEGNAAVGRGGPGYTQQIVDLATQAQGLGARVKLNTVVTKVNVDEDMHTLIRQIAPERWKVFQALRVEGQNETRIGPLLVTAEEFARFVARHQGLNREQIPLVAEDNDAMTDSYAMIDPLGRFFGNTRGVHSVGRPILQAGAAGALASVGFANDKLVARGGDYDWDRKDGKRRLAMAL